MNILHSTDWCIRKLIILLHLKQSCVSFHCKTSSMTTGATCAATAGDARVWQISVWCLVFVYWSLNRVTFGFRGKWCITTCISCHQTHRHINVTRVYLVDNRPGNNAPLTADLSVSAPLTFRWHCLIHQR